MCDLTKKRLRQSKLNAVHKMIALCEEAASRGKSAKFRLWLNNKNQWDTEAGARYVLLAGLDHAAGCIGCLLCIGC